MLRFLFAYAVIAFPPNGREIIRAMHDRYAGKRYRTLSFVQQNTATRPDGSQQHSVWREYAPPPGKLRTEFVPPDSGHGILLVKYSQFGFPADTLGNLSALTPPPML